MWARARGRRSTSAAQVPTTDGPSTEGATSNAGIDSPLFTYAHTDNATLVTGTAIVGGAFYRPSTVMFPSAWVGDYFFGDYVYRMDQPAGCVERCGGVRLRATGLPDRYPGGSRRRAVRARGCGWALGSIPLQPVGYFRLTVSGPDTLLMWHPSATATT